jgi:SAM-dependent methyltransferase
LQSGAAVVGGRREASNFLCAGPQATLRSTVPHSGGSFDPRAFWERRLQDFDLSAVGYAGLGLRYNRWLYRVRSYVFRRSVRRAATLDIGSASVLDIGSGTGFYINEWLRAGAEQVVGSDLTRVATERLREAFPGLEFVQLDISAKPPFPPGSFDAISAFDVLFHIVDDARYRSAIANITSLLCEGGYFFFSENFVHRQVPNHVHMVSRSLADIEDVLVQNRLEVVSRRPMFVVMNSPIDSENAVLQHAWHYLHDAVSRHEAIGAIAGALLFPLEVALVSILREGPSAEVMVCRKRPDHADGQHAG